MLNYQKLNIIRPISSIVFLLIYFICNYWLLVTYQSSYFIKGNYRYWWNGGVSGESYIFIDSSLGLLFQISILINIFFIPIMMLLLSIFPIIDILIYKSNYFLKPNKLLNFKKIFIAIVIVPMSHFTFYTYLVYFDVSARLGIFQNPSVDYVTLALFCIGWISLYMYNFFYFSKRFKYTNKKVQKYQGQSTQYHSY